jgi:hypothetical protein
LLTFAYRLGSLQARDRRTYLSLFYQLNQIDSR